ncbi:uncharacterized protein K444DRAFT_670385 [Hyaloscypha bicolor E]|uniref:Uncharacterized protein n=1 Tax=Hyaloscypha bicolor E TaxID=1095630 RepID=A0A2J6SIX8_9HELO|nr:uncharacterized protein K444DRAFT_670385 [Hyaloscypha bicolor E]PMD50732.1 hypothetical protein K444DRAFT_670385 [Hyaloscypha bicolor E]
MRRFSSASPVETGSGHLNGALTRLASSEVNTSAMHSVESLNPKRSRLTLNMRNSARNLLQRRPKSSTSSSTSITTELPAISPPPLAPGDQPTPIPLGQKVSAKEIRDLNELIRKRYALDVEIWSKRDCRPRDRKVIEDKMRRSDATLTKIMSTVRSWDRLEVWESDADWQRMRAIRDRLEGEGGKRIWKGNPPWDP